MHDSRPGRPDSLARRRPCIHDMKSAPCGATLSISATFTMAASAGVVQRLINRAVTAIWPNLAGMRVLGIGYAPPFLAPFHGRAERVLAAMPAGQGVIHWPAVGPALSALTDECVLPFPDRSIDRLLLVHCLEGTADAHALLRECWRVLADGGRLLVVVTNRRGLWARAEHVPFAQGRPFSAGQLTSVLRDSLFCSNPKHDGTLRATRMVAAVWQLGGDVGRSRCALVSDVRRCGCHGSRKNRFMRRRSKPPASGPAVALSRHRDRHVQISACRGWIDLAACQNEDRLFAEEIGKAAKGTEATQAAAAVESKAGLDHHVHAPAQIDEVKYRAQVNVGAIETTLRQGCRVTGMRPPNSNVTRMRQWPKLGRDTIALRPIRRSSSNTSRGRCVACRVWLRMA